MIAESAHGHADGVAVLSRVAQRHPMAVRMLCVRAADRAGPYPSAGAHHVVHAAQPDDRLRELVYRTMTVQTIVSGEAVRTLVGSIDQLPSVPRTYLDLSEAAARDETSVADIARIIQRDPAMSAKVLQLANSAFFGTLQRMASIQQAVSFLGFNSIKSLVLTSHVFSSLESSRVPGFSLERFQTYSLTVAALAKRFLAHSPFADEAFTAGLLHDLGRLVLVLRLPSRYAEVTRRVAEEGSTLVDAERAVLGLSHIEVGSHLLASWGLPFSIVEAVALHQAPAGQHPTEDSGVLAAVHAAHALLGILTCGDPEAALDTAFLRAAGFESRLPQWRALAQATADGLAQSF